MKTLIYATPAVKGLRVKADMGVTGCLRTLGPAKLSIWLLRNTVPGYCRTFPCDKNACDQSLIVTHPCVNRADQRSWQPGIVIAMISSQFSQFSLMTALSQELLSLPLQNSINSRKRLSHGWPKIHSIDEGEAIYCPHQTVSIISGPHSKSASMTHDQQTPSLL